VRENQLAPASLLPTRQGVPWGQRFKGAAPPLPARPYTASALMRRRGRGRFGVDQSHGVPGDRG
jgi:hypothetical protein